MPGWKPRCSRTNPSRFTESSPGPLRAGPAVSHPMLERVRSDGARVRELHLRSPPQRADATTLHLIATPIGAALRWHCAGTLPAALQPRSRTHH